jgi:excisionase family DNA binding protein
VDHRPVDRLYDPERVTLAASHAVERARARGAEQIEPEDLLVGMLYAVSRFGIVPFGEVEIDLEVLGLRFDVAEPAGLAGPRYADATADVFDRAARVARMEGAKRIAPIHFLAVLADQDLPLLAVIRRRYDLDSTGLRAALARVPPPALPGMAVAPAPSAGVRSQSLAHTGAQDPPTGTGLMNPEEAAAFLGLHIQTIRGYIRNGKLPAFRVAGERSIRVRRDDLLALLEVLAPAEGVQAALSASQHGRSTP